MIISVYVKIRSKRVGVFQRGEDYEVRVKAPPAEGAANEEVIELLSEYFQISKSLIKIKAGHTSKRKIIEIETGE
ncbi:MAG: DUF167 domain-containing protein [bacterium]|nr:DUF167 domain-containing protein [bacterium]